MKIKTINVTPVNIPLEAPIFWPVGTYPGATKVIVEVVTDDGLIGLGEAPSFGCAAALKDTVVPKLIGADALDMARCERLCVPETKVAANTDDLSVLKAFGAIEMALWDLRGKAWQQPLYQLLGGAVRKEISFTEYFALRQRSGEAGGEATAEEVAGYCAKMAELHGSTLFEGKCAPGDPHKTIDMVKRIRHTFGDEVMLRLDGNMGYSLTTARRVLCEIEPYYIDNFEDPVATFDEMAKLRQHSAIPFSSHIPDLRTAVRLGVPDNFVLNLTQLGGISRTLRFVAGCEQMGFGFWFYSPAAGVASTAFLHVAAATEHLSQPSQSLFRWQSDDVIDGGPYKPRNNVLRVPEGPGLGVALSTSGLKRCHERFLKQGPYDHYHDPANPGMYARLPLR